MEAKTYVIGSIMEYAIEKMIFLLKYFVRKKKYIFTNFLKFVTRVQDINEIYFLCHWKVETFHDYLKIEYLKFIDVWSQIALFSSLTS